MKFKLSTILISVFLVGLLLYGFVSLTSNDPYKDYAPGTELSIANTNGTADTVTPGNWPYPTAWNFNYSGIAGVNGGTVGASYYADKYWLNRWNAANVYLFANSGTNGGPGGAPTTITYTGSIRDMTVGPDGSGTDFIWGGKGSTTLYKFSPTGTTLGTYSLPQQMRAIAWDPNRKGFWACNWTTDIKCYDTAGVLKDTYAGGLALASKYGMAWDSNHAHPDTATLFVWHQTPGQTMTEVNLTTKTVIRSFLISAGTHIAGGADAYKSTVNSDWWLVLNYQNYANVAYKIGEDAPPPVPTFHYNATAGSGNTFPLGQSAGKFVNWLFPPGVFVNPTPCPVDSQIDTVWVRMYGTGTRTYTSLHVLMAQTTATNLTSGQFYAGPWDTVYYNASVTLTSPGANTWMPIVLQTPYPYDITKGLVVGIGQCSGSGSGMYVNQTTLTGTKRTWSIGGCPFAPYNSADSRNLCMGISVTPATGITPISNIPDKFSLSQNYPNPFNPATTINFSIPKSGLVTLKVFDVLGQEVATLVNDPKVAGTYSVNFDGSTLTSGVYFYRIEAGDYIDVKKMVLLK